MGAMTIDAGLIAIVFATTTTTTTTPAREGNVCGCVKRHTV
jgi:hypothetical protein